MTFLQPPRHELHRVNGDEAITVSNMSVCLLVYAQLRALHLKNVEGVSVIYLIF